ncbi:FAD dependent oxidoreductase [Gloeothece citriformis PCC 7424]|uniref:FAD dependent oxidoreductase n=1 Tax=Gloeothece citriformis (strain PCC 7424) TaxID=65393 RepID=B7KJI3_GLOC7|nr:N-methyl-L-tryptophan oxidase [Gloeothece citriformis]ACK73660.1 FAD dependent oxidoreductase [Gloeothece citriformis PCC 7424]
MIQSFDTIVIGGGGVGSAVAYYLAQSRQRVLVLEQFDLNHKKGSSYGYSRVIRYAYDNPIYIDLMRSAYPLWFALQEEAQQTLLIKTGQLDLGFPNTVSITQLGQSMDRANLSYERLTAREIQHRFPQFQLPETIEGFYQSETGILKASQCVLSHLKLAQKYGAIIQENTPVNAIKIQSNGVEIQTNQGTYGADKLMITAGSWSKQILEQIGVNLPLKIMPCQLAFFAPKTPEDFQPGKFPIFLAHWMEKCGEFPYGIPICDNSGLKISTFYGWETVENVKDVDYTPSESWIENLREFIDLYLPHANGKLVETRRCLYTMTPDKHFIIDVHPLYDHVFIAAGFSGHGFKFTTLVGKILADLAIKGTTDHDINLFKLSRF